ncbi:SapC family protein [Telluria beijingensis]|uniref:SapC family protein n=1 Tax=Telluria beijingensis TaxID=3068633 RepID=UPI00279580E7|nr:SapC family protein [Massilia sp. REN29]
MPNIALLNNIEHKDLRIVTGHRPGLGSEVAWVPTFADEFRSLQAHYPIIFRQLEDGASYEAIALLGFKEDENLFLEDGRWDAPLVPWLHERQPFYIGRNGDELMIQVDLDHPRVSQTEGEPVFKPHGGNTEFLDKTSAMLSNIHNGVQANAGFLEALKRHELFDGFVLDIEFENGDRNRMGGFFTIHEERLGALGGAAIAELHAAGYLAPMYFALASLSHFRDLIDRKNRRNRREATGA